MLSGTIYEEVTVLTVSELCRLCTAPPARIVELVEEGILTAEGSNAAEWRFAPTSLRRARIALRLQRDLEVNLAGVALALELLEEIDALRSQLKESA